MLAMPQWAFGMEIKLLREKAVLGTLGVVQSLALFRRIGFAELG